MANEQLARELEALLADRQRNALNPNPAQWKEAEAEVSQFVATNRVSILAALRTAEPAADVLHVVFDGPPGPVAGRFVEVETPDGRSINAGTWHERTDGYWELRLSAALRAQPAEPSEAEVDSLAAKFAALDGLDWNETCVYESGKSAEELAAEGLDDCCDSSTCVAAFYEDHDPDVARANYRKYAKTAFAALRGEG